MGAPNLFGSGIESALNYRDQLLQHLGAQTVLTDEDSDFVTWIPAVLGTRLGVVPASSEVTDLAELVVYTTLGSTTDVEAARAFVGLLNDFTSLNTWAVLGDPGPEGWWDDEGDLGGMPYEIPGKFRRQNHLVSLREEPGVYEITVGFSVVVGHASINLPIPIIAAIVSEQVAKATALATHDEDLPWLERAWVAVEDALRPSDEWEEVVYFFDNVITPRGRQEPQYLMNLLGQALLSIQSQQSVSTSGTWAGSGATGFTCEVPYGPGPFPDGVIGRQSSRGIESTDDILTALVQGMVVDNPHLGQGLLVTTKIPDANVAIEDPAWWSASLLNNLPRLRSPISSPAEAHGLGTWVVRDDQPVHFVFIPVAWEELFTADDLRQFFEQVLTNEARVVWSSRKVREPFSSLFPDGPLADPLPPMGFTAGTLSRGLAFGEPGVGFNPTAATLNSIYQLAVGQDREWSAIQPSSFILDTGVSLVQVRAARCDCDPPGTVVDVETPCPNPQTGTHMRDLVSRGMPAMVLGGGDGEALLSRLHIHDLAAAGREAFGPIGLQTLAAALTGAGVRLGERDQIDDIANVRAARPDYQRPDQGTSAGMTRAAEILDASAAQPIDWNTYKLTWSAQEAEETHTTVEYAEDPDLGEVLRITSAIPHNASDMQNLREALQSTLIGRTTVPISGDYLTTDHEITVVNTRWVASDPATDQHDHAQWVGGLVQEHAEAIRSALQVTRTGRH